MLRRRAFSTSLTTPSAIVIFQVVATKSCKARQGMLDDCLIRVPAAGRYVVEAGIVWEGRGRSVDRARLEIRRMSRDTKE